MKITNMQLYLVRPRWCFRRRMRELIQSKAWEEGGRIPSEHKLAEQLSVSRVVVREALQTLRTERWIITRHGAGSFVSNPNKSPAGRRELAPGRRPLSGRKSGCETPSFLKQGRKR